MTARRAAIYARVSTGEQTCDNQLLALRELAENAGFRVVEEYVDTGSGVSPSRSGMARMMEACHTRAAPVGRANGGRDRRTFALRRTP